MKKKTGTSLWAEKVETLCPKCHKGMVATDKEARFDPAGLFCPGCKSIYPVSAGYLELYPGEIKDLIKTGEFVKGSRPMLWRWLIRIYDGKWWRSSRWAGRLFRLPFEQEQEMIWRAVQLKKGRTLLDLATGTGIYAVMFADREPGADIIGLDLSIPMLEYAVEQKKKKQLTNLYLVHAAAGNLPFGKKQFDAVNCCGALHLFVDIESVLASIFEKLKDGGRFTFATARVSDNLFVRPAQWYMKKFKGIRGFRRGEIEEYLAKAGFSDIEILHAKGGWLTGSAMKKNKPDRGARRPRSGKKLILK